MSAIVAERRGEHLLVIRIDRPHRRNAFDGATAAALEAAIDRYEEDDALWCAILTGRTSSSPPVRTSSPPRAATSAQRSGAAASASWLSHR
jgi:1,4-dihydroxy-2-naphthoyl-CoA synthase